MGRPPAFVLAAEIVNDETAKLALHIEDIMGNAEDAADRAGILHIVNRAAAPVVFGQVGLVNIVELHRDANHIIALPVEQQGGHRRVHAAAHGDDHPVGDGVADYGVHSA